MKKYYKLYRNDSDIFENNYYDIPTEFVKNIEKRIKKDLKNKNLKLILVEITQNNNFTETTTNIWLLPIGYSIIWLKHTKNNIIYDYTGVIPLVHKGYKVKTWEQYYVDKFIK